MIIQIMKDFERFDQEDNVQQSQILEKMVQKLELENPDRQTSIERTMETSKKVQNVIQYLIQNENVLMISQEARVKNERYLTLNVNIDLENLEGFLAGNTNQA